MKTARLIFAVSVMAVILLGAGYALHRNTSAQNVGSLTLELQTDQQSYLPGEIVALHFSVRNTTSSPILLNNEATVWDGNLKVFVSYENGPFREYVGPGWGTRDRVPGAPLKLNPSQSFDTEATVLWNQKLETSHLNEIYAKKVAKQRLGTAYALSEQGRYYLKAVLFDARTGTSIESTPVSLTVEEVQGAELRVWNSLKENADYALLIQTGGLMEHPKGSKTLRTASELEKIVARHQDSRYARQIRSGLAKYKETVEHTEQPQPLEE
jgi:hypothetical protein